ncbi:MAG: KOW domain-containing RNA-binding protein [Clostridia bacterium]|nr:KOW domain-containing RNA-binding protein [Clostridia bacterium]
MGELKGRIVISLKGKDKGSLLVIAEDEFEILVTNGADRPLERLKKKNLKHLRTTNSFLDEKQMATNSDIRKALKAFEER